MFYDKYLEVLHASGFSAYLHGFSAIDSWLGRESTGGIHILTDAGTQDLASLFDNIRYPGINLADAALDTNEHTLYFTCTDYEKANIFSFIEKSKNLQFDKIKKSFALAAQFPAFDRNRPSFKILDFYQDCFSRNFHDPRGVYPLLAALRQNLRTCSAASSPCSATSGRGDKNKFKSSCLTEENILLVSNPFNFFEHCINNNCDYYKTLMDAALIMAGYFPSSVSITEIQIKKTADLIKTLNKASLPAQEEQRLLLTSLLCCENPKAGFELLKECGFIEEFWKELAVLDMTDQSKDFHPEGNAWKHTMETFRYRKSASGGIRLSLALLLHDTGKPIASSSGNNRFYGHAELGEMQARRFLERLGLNAAIIKDVCFLVRNHMITAAIPRLPLFRTENIMAHSLFPLLLELYRCDESSSFKGLNGYYESSTAYRSFLRNRRNPFRLTDGKIKRV